MTLPERLEKLSLKNGPSGVEEWLEKVRSSKPDEKSLDKILYRNQKDFYDWPLPPPKTTKVKKLGHKFVALDCEMIGTKLTKNFPARISLVSYHGRVLFDAFVKPDSKVVSYRTRYSGISPNVIEAARKSGNLLTMNEAIIELEELVNKHTVVGHGVDNDFRSLKWRPSDVIDTQKLKRFSLELEGPGLKRIMKHYYDIGIQNSKSGHNSVEDARATMLIFRTFENEFIKP